VGGKSRLAICITVAVLYSLILILFVTPMLEKMKYEGVFGISFDQVSDVPHIPDWITTDDLPKYIDMGLTYLAYIRDDEMPSQETLVYVFELLAGEIGVELEEQTAVELEGDLKKTIFDALNLTRHFSHINYESPTFAYTITPGLYNIFTSRTEGNVVINMNYSSDGKAGGVQKSITYSERGYSYLVTNINNNYLQKWNGKQNTSR